LEEFNESRHLCSQDYRQQGLHEEVHGPQHVRLLDRCTVGFVGRLEDDRDMPGFLSASDELRRLKSVQAGHLHVEQNDGELALQQLTQRLLTGLRLHQGQVESFKDSPERKAIGRFVIDQQYLRM
jgi:hypothetical protein